MSDQPCVYCTLPADEMGRCKVGFPGCPRADDQMGCPHLGAAIELNEARKELARLKAGPDNDLRKTVLLRDYSEIIDHLQLCQDKEDELFGDMRHNYFEQAITVIKDLDALVIDLTTYRPPARPEPLTRPDKPGWWWCWRESTKEWDLIQVMPTVTGRYDYGLPGKWLPATPPPAPEKGVEG